MSTESPRLYTFIELPVFMRQLETLASLDTLYALQADLLEDPERWPVIKGAGGARKGRVADPKGSRGKSGSFRSRKDQRGKFMSATGKKHKKQKQMSDDLFGELMQSLDQALRYSRGEQINARTTVLPAPPDPMTREEIVKLRERFNCSQAIFARLLNVSVKTLQAWEQGLRVPSDAALKLLNIASNHPDALLS